MKLAVFEQAGGPVLGLVHEGRLHPVAPLLGEPAIADVRALLELQYDGIERLRHVTVPDTGGVELDDVRLLPPVLQPPNIRDHILFEEHATKTWTREIPEVWRRKPLHYYTNTSRLIGHEGLLAQPASERLDYELEIGAVIGTECSNVAPADAMSMIAGFVIFNDWSARDLQADEMAYGLGPSKGKDFGSSLGPWMVTVDELTDYLRDDRLHVRCRVRVNGHQWADGDAGEMFHSWATMVEHASLDSRLVPGDILGSGTVGGCSIGEAIRKGVDARYLLPGDRVELEVEGIGVLANTIGPPADRPLPDGYLAAEPPPMPTPLV